MPNLSHVFMRSRLVLFALDAIFSRLPCNDSITLRASPEYLFEMRLRSPRSLRPNVGYTAARPWNVRYLICS